MLHEWFENFLWGCFSAFIYLFCNRDPESEVTHCSQPQWVNGSVCRLVFKQHWTNLHRTWWRSPLKFGTDSAHLWWIWIFSLLWSWVYVLWRWLFFFFYSRRSALSGANLVKADPGFVLFSPPTLRNRAFELKCKTFAGSCFFKFKFWFFFFFHEKHFVQNKTINFSDDIL